MATRYVYLGRRVPDVKKKGLDSVKEYRGIANAIVQDCKKHRISLRTAQGRLLLLYRLVDKNSKLKAKASTKKQLKQEIRRRMKEIKNYC